MYFSPAYSYVPEATVKETETGYNEDRKSGFLDWTFLNLLVGFVLVCLTWGKSFGFSMPQFPHMLG